MRTLIGDIENKSQSFWSVSRRLGSWVHLEEGVIGGEVWRQVRLERHECLTFSSAMIWMIPLDQTLHF